MKSVRSSKAQTPENIAKLFVEAWNNRDAGALADLFTEDAEFVNVVGLWWHSKKDIFKAHDYGLKVMFKDSTLELRRTTVKQLSSDVAVVHARMRLSGQARQGDIIRAGSRQNIFSFVTQKFNGNWLCVAAHNTDIVPGAETNIIDESGKMKAANYRDQTND